MLLILPCRTKALHSAWMSGRNSEINRGSPSGISCRYRVVVVSNNLGVCPGFTTRLPLYFSTITGSSFLLSRFHTLRERKRTSFSSGGTLTAFRGGKEFCFKKFWTNSIEPIGMVLSRSSSLSMEEGKFPSITYIYRSSPASQVSCLTASTKTAVSGLGKQSSPAWI